MNFDDLTGRKFGRLIVIERAEDYISTRNYRMRRWACRCECGQRTIVLEQSLKSNATRSCGCYRNDHLHDSKNLIDLSGKRFGRLTVIKKADKNKTYRGGQSHICWLCRCDCGKKKITTTQGLNSGRCKSCGCFNRDAASTRFFKDLSGKKFGKLFVICRTKDYTSPQGNSMVQYRCKCDCGNFIVVLSGNLKRRSHTLSCGCNGLESHIARELKKYCKKEYSSVSEYRKIKNPKTGYYLPYDIFIPPSTYIEIHGLQHYKITSFHKFLARHTNNSELDVFLNQRYRDKIKKKYAQQTGTFIEIDLRKIHTVDDAIKYIERRLT